MFLFYVFTYVVSSSLPRTLFNLPTDWISLTFWLAQRMSRFTPREYADMHFIYGECRGVGREAARLYRERYPDRRHPDHRVFGRVHNAYSEGRIPGTGVGGASEGRPQVHTGEK